MSADCYYFGCWNDAGHHLYAPGGVTRGLDFQRIEHYGDYIHLDGTLAPKREKHTKVLTWEGNAATRSLRDAIHFDSVEYPQGQFLRHYLDNGFTVIQWWDRTQGDERSACNSTILLKGDHTTEEMLAALAEHFPHVLSNLTKAGVTLSEVTK